MKVFLAGTNTRDWLYENLSCRRERQKQDDSERNWGGQDLFVLESYYDLRANKRMTQLLPVFSDFLLDSGAFTFLQGSHKGSVNWEYYVDEYADFININNVKKFFELDIDPIIGIDNVERLRKRLEQKTGKQSIPVWHKNRGKEYFVNMTKEYQYIALGGIAIKEIARNTFEKMFPYFINTAHENNCKIHGLGYTGCANLRKYHFDSVDSTAWLYGNRGGYLYCFNPQLLNFFEKITPPSNMRLHPIKSAEHNFNEWRKFQQYAYKHL